MKKTPEETAPEELRKGENVGFRLSGRKKKGASKNIFFLSPGSRGGKDSRNSQEAVARRAFPGRLSSIAIRTRKLGQRGEATRKAATTPGDRNQTSPGSLNQRLPFPGHGSTVPCLETNRARQTQHVCQPVQAVKVGTREAIPAWRKNLTKAKASTKPDAPDDENERKPAAGPPVCFCPFLLATLS